MKPYLTSLSCFSPIMAPTSHIAYLTLALGFLIFCMCLLHILSYLLKDCGACKEENQVSCVTGRKSRCSENTLSSSSASKAVVTRKKLLPQFYPVMQFLPTHCDNGCLSVTHVKITLRLLIYLEVSFSKGHCERNAILSF